MKASRVLRLPTVVLPLLFAGCIYTSSSPSTAPKGVSGVAPAAKSSEAAATGPQTADAKEKEEAEIRENLAGLTPEDRKLAEAQKYCAVQTTERLGGDMGTPFKIMIKDQPVFLCCGHCKKDALKDPDKTLASVAKLKEKAAEEAKKKQ